MILRNDREKQVATTFLNDVKEFLTRKGKKSLNLPRLVMSN